MRISDWSSDVCSSDLPIFTQVYRVTDGQELGRLIDQGKVIAALDIQPDFSRAIAAGDSGRIQLLIDGRRSNSGQITASYLSAIAAEVGAEANPGTGPATPVAVRNWFNPNLTYRWFIVPGLSGILALDRKSTRLNSRN